MSWQEELQQLDTELAQGRVTAEDYRQRRDQLIGLAQQSGAQQADPAQQQQRPDQGNGPFGAPFRWQPGSQDSVESTQVMKPIGDDPSSQNSPERTQVVSPSAGQGENPDRTQVVPGSTPSPQQNFPPLNYQGFGQQQQASWVQPPAASSAAPWNSDEDPKPPNPSDISWMRQGPEVFNEGSGSKGKVVGAVAVVALLVAAAFGAYLLWGRGGSPNAGGQNDGTTTTTTKPNDPLLADLPGISQLPPENQIRTWADVVKLNYLTAGDKPNETTAYESGSPTDARVAISKHDDDRIIVLVVQESSPETAKQAKAQLGDLQVRYGQTPLTVQPNVLASGLDNVPGPAPVLRRAHYYSGRYVVRIEVDGANPNVADKDFRDTLTAELAKLAANA